MKRLIEQFYIKDKNAHKVKFRMNKAQLDYESKRTGRDIILKARQMGFTTYEQLRKLERVLLKHNVTSATISHKMSKTLDIFRISQFAWDSLPERFKARYKVKYDSAKELAFENTASRYFVDVSMRSATVQDLHVSEVAMMGDINDLFASSLESVPKEGTITLETTANGLWVEAVAGKNEFCPHFYNWTWDVDYKETPPENNSWKDDYLENAKKYDLIADIQNRFELTDAQFYWYYLKSIRLQERTKQEYPTIPEEAFLASSISVFDLYKVSQLQSGSIAKTINGANIYKEPIAGHRYIIGCDTAEGMGGDRTAIEVWDMTDMDKIEEVASFSDDTIRPDQTADLMIHLGIAFNEAFLIPERNSSGLSTVLKIQDRDYSNLFVNRTIDKKTQKTKNEYGWRTMGSNRDLMIDDFIELFENDKLIIHSERLIQEMKTFVRKENGRREHDDGYHDDTLFASFLAIQGNKYQRSSRVFTSKAKGF